MKATLTITLVTSLFEALVGRNLVVFDGRVPGLVVDIRATAVTFWLRWKSRGGKSHQIKIGRWVSDVTLAQARQRATELRAMIALGKDPLAERRSPKKTTVREFVETRYLPEQRARNRGWREEERLIRQRVLPSLGMKSLVAITAADVRALHIGVIADGRKPATANRTLAAARGILSLAVENGEIERNPAKSVRAFRENNLRTRFLSPPEINGLVAALDLDPDPVGASAVKMLLLSGARRGEVLSARWQDVDLGRRLWVVPNPKGGRAHHRPLSWAAVELLQSLPRRADDPRVFPGGAPSRPRSLRALWERVRRAAGLDKVRLHDLRHTFASIAVGRGVPLFTVRQLLGHASSTTTERYAHLAPGHLADANDLVTAAVLGSTQWAAPTNHPDSN